MIIDFHCHQGKDIAGEEASFEDIEREQTNNKIMASVVFPFNCLDLVEQSRQILEHAQKNKNIIPFLRFDPKSITPKILSAELQRGYKGVKLHPRSQQFFPDDEQWDWIYTTIAAAGLPLLFHSKAAHYEPMSHPERIIRLAKRFPQLKVIIGHAAGGEDDSYPIIIPVPNVYVETSIYSLPILFEEMYFKYRFDRFVFGSDFPYNPPELELLKITLAKIPEAVKEKILWKNAADILALHKE